MAGLGNAALGSRTRLTSRQEEISRAGRAARPPRVAPGTPPGFGGPKASPGPAAGNGGTAAPAGGGGQGGGVGLSGNERPGLGRQLTRRVNAGTITDQQAQRTMQQRQTFKKAYGADWRQKVFGGVGAAQKARTQLSANPNDPKAMALNQRLLAQRKSMLSAAKQKLGGGKVNPQGRGFMNPPGQSY